MEKKDVPKRILTMNVSAAGFRNIENNPQRIQFALHLLTLAKTNKTDCVFFPSGYLISRKIEQIRRLLVPITKKARNLHISFVFGVDLTGIFRTSPDANDDDFLKIVIKRKMPCLLASYNAHTNSFSLTRQRSCTTEHVRLGLVPDEIMTPRIMDFGTVQMQIVHCGETYDSRLFTNGSPRVCVVLGHLTMPRLSRTLHSKSSRGFSLINSEHRHGTGGWLFGYEKGRDKSVHGSLVHSFDGDLWANLALWEVNRKGRIRAVPLQRHG